MKRPRLLVGAAILIVLAGAWAWLPRWLDTGGKRDTLLVSGNIEAHESLVSFKVQGRIVELPVEEGQWVERGALLARLDADDYRQQVAVRAAALRVQQAELTRALAGSRRQEIAAARRAVDEARAVRTERARDYHRARQLFAQEVVSSQFRDQAETDFKRADADLLRLQQIYDQTVEGTRKEDLEVARAAVNQARQDLELARVMLGYTVLRAPKAGVILVRQAELGEVVVPGTPVVTLADLGDIWLRAYIAETDLGRVKWGQPAWLTTDTYPGKRFRGRISFISAEAEFTPKSVETHKERVTLVYRIKIEVDNPAHELKPGMPADATIDVMPPRSEAGSRG